jgi:hypothetical protein
MTTRLASAASAPDALVIPLAMKARGLRRGRNAGRESGEDLSGAKAGAAKKSGDRILGLWMAWISPLLRWQGRSWRTHVSGKFHAPGLWLRL